MTSHEIPQRSLVKSLTWRVVATLTTIIIVYVFTSDLAIAGTVGGIEVIAKLIIYYVHDRVWNHVAWGINDE